MKEVIKKLLVNEKGQGTLLGRSLVWLALIAILLFIFKGIFWITSLDDPKIGAPEAIYDQYFTYVYVESGMTVSDIYYLMGDEYPDTMLYWSLEDYVANVIFINHLDSKETIKYGTEICVPYLKPKGVDVVY